MHLRRTRREGSVASLQEPLESASDGGLLTLADVLPDETCMEDGCERRDSARRVRRLLNTLDARSQQVLVLRYGLLGDAPLTQQQVAGRMGISRSYVSRIEKRALAALREGWEK